MLPIISNQNFTPIPPNESISRQEYEKRCKAIKAFTKDLKTQAHLESIHKIMICRIQNLFEVTPSTSIPLKTIYVPAMLFLTPSDFGFEFQGIKNLEEFDQKLEADPQFLQRLSDRITQIFKEPKIVVNYEHRESLRMIMRYITKDPELAKQGVRFVILHELGHLHHQHRAYQIHWIVTTDTTTLAALSFIVASALGLIGYGLLLAVITVVAAEVLQRGVQILHSRAQEREADFIAMSRIDGKEGKKIRKGGIYLFEILREHQMALRDNSRLPFRERLLFNLIFSPKGDNRFLYFTHPSERERIQNIKNFEKSKNFSRNLRNEKNSERIFSKNFIRSLFPFLTSQILKVG